MGFRLRAGLVALLLGAAACGDDDGGGSVGPSGPADQDGATSEGGGGTDIFGDPCSVLEVSEIEQLFGDRGAVADGDPLGANCSWQVGSGSDAGFVGMGVVPARPDQSTEDAVTADGQLSVDLVEAAVSGVDAGDALFDASSGFLWFRSGDLVIGMSGLFDPEVEGLQDKLVVLAEQVLQRL
jgi:hypothetical protein